MKRLIQILPAACLAAGLMAGAATCPAWAADSPFIGQWKLNPAKSRLPDEMKVARAGAKYDFDFGGAVETITVDGTFQPGYGATLLSVKAQAPDTWIVQRKQDGQLQIKATWTLSKDARTLTDNVRQFGVDGSILSMHYVYRRAGGGPGFAGDWQSIQETMNSPYAMEVKGFEGDGLSLITPSQHATKNVKPDGKDYAKAGGASTSTQRVDDHTLLITDKAGGQLADTRELGLSADLKTLTMTVRVPGHDRPTVMVFERS